MFFPDFADKVILKGVVSWLIQWFKLDTDMPDGKRKKDNVKAMDYTCNSQSSLAVGTVMSLY